MANDSLRSLGLDVPVPFDVAGPPVPVLIAEWEWRNPLRTILRVSGWTIDDVISSPGIAREVRMHWRATKMVERRARDRERRAQLREEIALLEFLVGCRRQGLPVPCAWCGCLEPCSCDSLAS
jgi:hypothetical protein